MTKMSIEGTDTERLLCVVEDNNVTENGFSKAVTVMVGLKATK